MTFTRESEICGDPTSSSSRPPRHLALGLHRLRRRPDPGIVGLYDQKGVEETGLRQGRRFVTGIKEPLLEFLKEANPGRSPSTSPRGARSPTA